MMIQVVGSNHERDKMSRHLRADLTQEKFSDFKAVKVKEECSTNAETIERLLEVYDSWEAKQET